MEITEVRVRLVDDSDDRLQAFCSITFDDSFVVRDLKVIEGTNGPFVAMPARKVSLHCPKCRAKNQSSASYCSHCGVRLEAKSGGGSNEKLYADIAHPINSSFREVIQNRVIEEFEAERQKSFSARADARHSRSQVASPSRRTTSLSPSRTTRGS